MSSKGPQLIGALALAPLVWPFLVLLRIFLGVPSAWDLGFLPLTLGVHALVAYAAFMLLAFPTALYLRRGGGTFVIRAFLAGLVCGLAALAILAALLVSRFTWANAIWAALGGALSLAAFAALAPGPGEESAGSSG